jgi:hypothetical protein
MHAQLNRFFRIAMVFACGAVAACATAPVRVLRANVITLAPDAPRATALAVSNGLVLAVGSVAEVRLAARRSGRTVIEEDLEGTTIVPGLGDAHGHLASLGDRLHAVPLEGASSFDEVVARVAAAARERPHGEWIFGRGWDQTRWPTREFPTHHALSRAVPNHPVVLRRVDGHASLVNARALAIAGISRNTPEVDGGRILRDASGAPTGVLVDRAASLVRPPKLSREQRLARLRVALRRCAEVGLTMVHDLGLDEHTLALLRALEVRRELPLRVVGYRFAGNEAELRAALAAELDPEPDMGWRVLVRGVKLMADGAMGSRGAALLEPYADEPTRRGHLLWPRDALRDAIVRIARAGLQPAVHAIGDDAVREVLATFASLPRGALPPRIEHLQLLPPEGAATLRALSRGAGIVASMQPTHLASDMRWVLARLGATRAARAYAWRTASDAGALLAFGSDFPVEDPSPLLGIHAAATRGDVDGRSAKFGAIEAISREVALRAFTEGVARSAGLRRHGWIIRGAPADLTVLDRDVLAVDPKGLLATRVLRTYVGGEEVFRWRP